MIETELQNDYVMDFLCRRADGLKYREVKNTTVNNDLFIPADMTPKSGECRPIRKNSFFLSMDRYHEKCEKHRYHKRLLLSTFGCRNE